MFTDPLTQEEPVFKVHPPFSVVASVYVLLMKYVFLKIADIPFLSVQVINQNGVVSGQKSPSTTQHISCQMSVTSSLTRVSLFSFAKCTQKCHPS